MSSYTDITFMSSYKCPIFSIVYHFNDNLPRLWDQKLFTGSYEATSKRSNEPATSSPQLTHN